ncbi:hypothetical protein ACQKDS_13110 [Serratia sp. NPDC078593]|uniref:hypothetical protein n=1 Tax=unclassified Serratia (in: enterobacteria) TaxID=2647522 RepID=UPI0037CF00D2
MTLINVSGFRERYENSRWYTFGIQFALTIVVGCYIQLATRVGSPDLAALQAGLTPEEATKYDPSIFCWMSLVLLFRGFLYDQRSLAWGLLAGLCWVCIGDTVAAGVWASSMFFMLYLLAQRKTLGWIHLWYLLLWLLMLSNYNLVYEDIHHYGYLCLFAALFMLSAYRSLPLSQRIAKMIADASKPEPRQRNSAEKHTSAANAGSQENAGEESWLNTEGESIIVSLENYPTLDKPMRTELNGIVKYARLIQQCVVQDPNDIKPGSEFLKRYLPYTLRLLNEGYKLASQLDIHGASGSINNQGLESLRSLHSAFKQKHAQLLENDTLAYKSDLSLLDSLLKTDGLK